MHRRVGSFIGNRYGNGSARLYLSCRYSTTDVSSCSFTTSSHCTYDVSIACVSGTLVHYGTENNISKRCRRIGFRMIEFIFEFEFRVTRWNCFSPSMMSRTRWNHFRIIEFPTSRTRWCSEQRLELEKQESSSAGNSMVLVDRVLHRQPVIVSSQMPPGQLAPGQMPHLSNNPVKSP